MSATWTPVNGKCAFCNKEEHGYALKDKAGEFQPACWPCAKKRIKEEKDGNDSHNHNG
ncbi:MAG TPA: hypothetical protein VMH89_10510 [Candidatus Acidoferrum sp.]|nr:hypothetical protein [Candidatus Acidoferrum sp.]